MIILSSATSISSLPVVVNNTYLSSLSISKIYANVYGILIWAQNQNAVNIQKEQIDSLKMWIVIALIFAFLIIVATSFIIQSNRLLKKQNATILDQQEKISQINKDLEIQIDNLKEMNEEKNSVISYVSHDLLTPFVNIEGLIQLMRLNEQTLNNDQKEYMTKMNAVVDSGKDLIHNLLNINKIEQEIRSIELMEYDAVKLVEEVVKMHELLANKKNITIHQHHDIDILPFKTDKHYFKQIISNLLSNAIKFSEPGETVYTSVKDLPKTVQIMVIDKGPGISETDKDRIFLKYEQVSNRPTANEKSAGLGLAIAKQLVHKLNGKIRVESELNKGTTFTVEFLKNS